LNDALNSCQEYTMHMYTYVSLSALVKMESFFKFLPSVNKSHVQVCLPNDVGENCKIH